MKSYQLHSAPAILVRFPTFRKRLEEEKLSAAQRQQPLSQVFLGGDLEKAGVCLAGAIGLQEPLALITLTREEACHLVADILRLGFEVHVALEACGFGWVFPEQLRAAGAKSVLTLATEPLTGKRKTNHRDAAALCRVAAARIAHGDNKAGRIVREPSFEEQRDRFYYRHRQQLIGIREKEGAYGRSLLHDLGIHDAPEGWWGKYKWRAFKERLADMGERAAFALEIMTPLQELILHTHARILELDKKLAVIHTQKVTVPMPKGLGDATATAVILELMDPARFKNRKQVGSFIGCGICEYSTGTGQTLGSIDKMGNGRIRSALTEAIWRLIKWEPGWRGFKKWGAILTDKKAG